MKKKVVCDLNKRVWGVVTFSKAYYPFTYKKALDKQASLNKPNEAVICTAEAARKFNDK